MIKKKTIEEVILDLNKTNNIKQPRGTFNIHDAIKNLIKGNITRINNKINSADLKAIYQKGIDATIYAAPQKKYKRTGNLKKAVKVRKTKSDLKLQYKVYVDGSYLAKLSNPNSYRRNYRKFVASTPTQRWISSRRGYQQTSEEMVEKFILKQIMRYL